MTWSKVISCQRRLCAAIGGSGAAALHPCSPKGWENLNLRENYQKLWKFAKIQQVRLNYFSFRAQTSLFGLAFTLLFSFFRFQAYRRDRRVCCNSAKWHTRAHIHARPWTSPFPSLLWCAEGSGCWRVTTTLLCTTCLHFSRKLGLVFAAEVVVRREKKVGPRSSCFPSSHDRKVRISEASSCEQHFYSHRCSTNDWQHFWNVQSRVFIKAVDSLEADI